MGKSLYYPLCLNLKLFKLRFSGNGQKGFIYKGLKPVYWCADCETALAEAEIEYSEKTSDSIYVKFPVIDGKGIIPEDAYVVIWTTTPWTIPANLAISVHPEFDYVLVKAGNDEKYVMAKGLLEEIAKIMEWPSYEIIKGFKGEELERVKCRHPLFDRDSIVILGTHVTLEAGTGCVHTAPGHGEDDFYVCKEYGIDVISPVNDSGKFTAEAGKYQGLYVQDANKEIIKDLDGLNMLLKAGKIEHQYPYCWRCKHPIIYRATEQWFASIEGFRSQALDAIDSVKWIPAWGRERIYNMVRDRGDWCISRQRTWGYLFPSFIVKIAEKALLMMKPLKGSAACLLNMDLIFGSARVLMSWYRQDLKCSCGGAKFSKETDIMDVWFDSGSVIWRY